MRRKFSTPSREHPKKDSGASTMDRRSLIRTSFAGVFSVYAGGVATMCELSQPAKNNGNHSLEMSPNLEGVKYLLRQDFPDMRFIEQYNQAPTTNNDHDAVKPDSVAEIAERIYHYVAEDIPHEEPTGNFGLEDPVKYISSYCLSREESQSLPKNEIDCNDATNWVCELLDEKHVPVYLVSTWANKPEDDFRHWHVLAVCKIHQSKYLILDSYINNDQDAITWHGSLAQFIKQYKQDDANSHDPQVRIVPFGISRYVKPKYNNVPAKWLIQRTNTIEDENDMECIGESSSENLIAKT